MSALELAGHPRQDMPVLTMVTQDVLTSGAAGELANVHPGAC